MVKKLATHGTRYVDEAVHINGTLRQKSWGENGEALKGYPTLSVLARRCGGEHTTWVGEKCGHFIGHVPGHG
jgi:hypothetical protein